MLRQHDLGFLYYILAVAVSKNVNEERREEKKKEEEEEKRKLLFINSPNSYM